jgi:glucuronate isomerase
MKFIHEDFLLHTRTARRWFHQFAEEEPIFDYHCHLPPRDIAQDRQFRNLFEIWLEGDHYKWRAMRSNGVAERYCTGAAEPFEKFCAWAATVPHTLRNPLYHWTHLELKRYFGIDELLDEGSAPRIWEAANAQLAYLNSTKEGGRQIDMLQAYHVANALTTNCYAATEAALLAVAVTKAYYAPGHGVIYEVNNDWTPRVLSNGLEDWVTTEAMGIVTEALFSQGDPVPW